MTLNNYQIVCAGSALIDTIGYSKSRICMGDDVAGTIKTNIGGVAFNICKQLALSGLPNVELLTALGNDTNGQAILDFCDHLGIITSNIYVCNDSETDSYLAIEDKNGLKAAIANVKNVEKFSEKILKPLEDGVVKINSNLNSNLIILDGNLSPTFLRKIAENKSLNNFDIRIASASPSKAIRLKPFLRLSNATIYCNKTEAENLCGLKFKNTKQASSYLLKKGLGRAIVTNGNKRICDSSVDYEPISILPPKVKSIGHVTGAGDYFLACHIINEINQLTKTEALKKAAESTSKYVETEI
tara:strand:+ start:2073 stop:2972 length:900 start_codon:yes stop_codon:yes gene_type:complete